MNELKIEDYREHYNNYFKEFHRLAVGEYADLSYGSDQPNGTASSLESIIAYANYILSSGDGERCILNAGAGASSFVLRKIFSDVVCIDPNKKYLELVKLICKENDLSDDYFEPSFHYLTIAYFTISSVYYDYGDIERVPYLGMAIEAAKVSVYVDDTDDRKDCLPYRSHVQELCKKMGLKHFDCIQATDEHGRWGIIIEK